MALQPVSPVSGSSHKVSPDTSVVDSCETDWRIKSDVCPTRTHRGNGLQSIPATRNNHRRTNPTAQPTSGTLHCSSNVEPGILGSSSFPELEQLLEFDVSELTFVFPQRLATPARPLADQDSRCSRPELGMLRHLPCLRSRALRAIPTTATAPADRNRRSLVSAQSLSDTSVGDNSVLMFCREFSRSMKISIHQHSLHCTSSVSEPHCFHPSAERYFRGKQNQCQFPDLLNCQNHWM